MFVMFQDAQWKVEFVHHNPSKPKFKMPAGFDEADPDFAGTRCKITCMRPNEAGVLEPMAFVQAYAHLAKHGHWETSQLAFTRRFEQFNKQLGRMVSLRRAAKMMFGKRSDEEFVQAYLQARKDGDLLSLGY